MKRLAKRIPGAASLYQAWQWVKGQFWFRRDYRVFRRMLAAAETNRLPLRWSDRYPCYFDRTSTTPFDRHYVLHTAWAARSLAKIAPTKHLDISSCLYFVAIVSGFVPVDFFDFRPADLGLSNLTCGHADLTRLPFASRSVESLSCMHVVEHIGLGRYGDPLDPDGDLKAMKELQRVVAPAGNLLFVVPVGKPRIAFNAHRIYSSRQIVECFDELSLREFALIPDDPADGTLVSRAQHEIAECQSYGCGCFWFTRPPSS